MVLLIIARRRSRSVQQSMRQYMDRFTGGMDSARSSNMLFAPLPMMVFDMDTQAVVWCNNGFLALTEQKEGVFDAHLNAVVPTFSVRWLMEGKNECPEHVVWNHRIYRVYGGLTRPTPDTPATMATTYWMDVTDSEQLRQTLQMTRPVVAILMVDNYEDLMKACPESKRSAVLAQLEEKLDQWSAGADGLMLHYDRDRYLFVFEERSYSDYAQHRFAVLDTVREVAAGGVAATLGVVFPSLIIISLLAGVITTFAEVAWVKNAFAGIRVCVCVLIFNAVVKLWKKSVVDKKTLALYALILLASLLTDLSPVIFVLFAAVSGIVLQVALKKGGEAE